MARKQLGVPPTNPPDAATKAYVDGKVAKASFPFALGFAASDETSDLEAGTDVLTFRLPWDIDTISEVRAEVTEAPSGSTLVVDINADGSSILSTKLSIDAGETTSVTAAVPPVILKGDHADNTRFTVDLDQVGSANPGKGLKIWIIGTRTAS